jgi:ATP-binding cassette, subfamily B (MDR/TAP), member 1
LAYFDNVGAGEIATTIQTDCHLVEASISEQVPVCVEAFSNFAAGFAVAYFSSVKLAAALSSFLPLIIVCAIITVVFVSKYTMEQHDTTARAATMAEEAMSSIRTIHAFNMGAVLIKQFERVVVSSKMAGTKEIWSFAAIYFIFSG